MPLNLETYQVGPLFEALIEGVLLVPLDSRYTQVGFNLISVQVLETLSLLMHIFRLLPCLKAPYGIFLLIKGDRLICWLE